MSSMYRDKYHQNSSYDDPFAPSPLQSINPSRETVAPYPVEDANECINPVPVFTSAPTNLHSKSPARKQRYQERDQRYEMPFQHSESLIEPLPMTSSQNEIPPSLSTPTFQNFSPGVTMDNKNAVAMPGYEESNMGILREKQYRVDSVTGRNIELHSQPQEGFQSRPMTKHRQKSSANLKDESRDLSSYSPKAIEFYKIYREIVNDFYSGNFTHEIQMKWCETLLEYAFDDDFLAQYNINAEKLKRSLRPDECLKNQNVILGHSFRVLQKLLSHRFGPAVYLMGTLYSHQPYLRIKNKNIVDRNDKKALEYYCRAAKTDYSEAFYRAGVCFEYQRGTPTEADFTREKSLQLAFQYYQKGAIHCGNPSCMYKLGMFYLYGFSGQQQPLEALQWFKKAGENAKSTQALYELGKIYEFISLPPQIQSILTKYSVNRDPTIALKYFHRCATDCNYPLAQWKLGYCYEFGELQLPVIAKKSIAWYAKAALAEPKGNPMAMLALSGWYLTGAQDVLKPNDEEAFRWALKACEASDGKLSRAEYALACYYENGIGCRKDLKQAGIHFETAAKLGHIKAKDRLEKGL